MGASATEWRRRKKRGGCRGYESEEETDRSRGRGGKRTRNGGDEESIAVHGRRAHTEITWAAAEERKEEQKADGRDTENLVKVMGGNKMDKTLGTTKCLQRTATRADLESRLP